MADQEGHLLRRLNLNPDILIEMMRRLEKVLPPNKVKLILTLNGREYVLEDDQNPDEALRAVIEKELKRGELKKITLSRENPYGDAVYFPSQKTLEQYGVSGIVTYAYPVDQNALKKLYEGRARRWKLVPIRIAGDFEQTDRQE
ncbi:MAG: hypothetical protein E6Q34_00165 [Burkholderiaceae bacterium]|nr:MAG: hypothetical protein E6Q34_00165 [Burkholderiaceae bacterium]